MRITVVGSGYVGIVTGAGLAHLGHEVACVEVDPDRLAALRRLEVPIHEPGLQELVTEHARAGVLTFTGQLGEALEGAELAFVAVNTPSRPDGSVDVQFVDGATTQLLWSAPRGLIVVLKSTVPVGTADRLANVAKRADNEIEIVSNPEFLQEGSAVSDFLHPNRIVIGGSDEEAIDVVAGLYRSIDAPVLRVSRRAAELSKYAANAYLATRVSFMNEMAQLCQATSVDIEDVERIVGSDHRIGPHFLKAGLGWGGSCFPKDSAGLLAMGLEHGTELSIVRAAIDANRMQQDVAVQRILEALGHPTEPTVCLLGLSFKPETDDVRESPALRVASGLLAAGARVQAYDPVATENARRVRPELAYCSSPYDASDDADALLVATEWPMFRELDWERIAGRMRGRIVFDGRNILDAQRIAGAGFEYHSFGRAADRGMARTIDTGALTLP